MLKDDGCSVGTSALVPLALSPDALDAFLVFHEALVRQHVTRFQGQGNGCDLPSQASVNKTSTAVTFVMSARIVGLLIPCHARLAQLGEFARLVPYFASFKIL